MTEKKKFSPRSYRCTECGDVIHSSYPGQFVTCSCTKIAVDQTEHYIRLIGNREHFKEVE